MFKAISELSGKLIIKIESDRFITPPIHLPLIKILFIIMNRIELKDKNLFYIGGIVRDKILGRECFDIDITYIGNAIEFAKTIDNAEIIKINEPFGTVRIKLNGLEIDLASTRDEKYPRPGHLPEVTDIGCSLKKDVQRRDFTINTLTQSLETGEIIDYLGGLDDIKNKKIRILHDKSFIDDPTRIIRALKFSVRFGFELDKHTKKLQEEYLNNINYDMSYKRVKKELIETFNLNSQTAYERFFKENIYKLLTVENIKAPDYNIQTLIEKYPVKDIWLVYLGWMDLNKLPLTKRETKIINDYNYIKNEKFDEDYSIYKAFLNIEKESLLLYAINIDEKPVFRYLDYLSKIKLNITGKDLQKMNIPPSSKYSQCFEYLLKAKLNNPDIDEIKLAKEFFKL